MNRYLISILLCVTACSSPTSDERKAESDEYLKKGMHLLIAAETDYELVDGEYTLHPSAYPKLETARAELNKSIELNPNNATALILLGNSYWAINDLDTALNYYNKAVFIDSDEEFFISARCGLHLNMGNLNKALDDLETLKQLDSAFYASNAEHIEWYKEEHGIN